MEVSSTQLTNNRNHIQLTNNRNRIAARGKTDIVQRLERYSQIATLWVKGEEGKEIAKKLGMDKSRVSAAINHELPVVAFAARDFVEKLHDIGYFSKMTSVRTLSTSGSIAQVKTLHLGIWPYNHKAVPTGYTLGEEGQILADPAQAPALQRVFHAVAEGDIIGQAARKEGFKPHQVYGILRNPRFWMGKVPDLTGFGGYVPGRHKVLLDEDTWEKIQQKRPGRPFGRSAYGFKREGQQLEVDEKRSGIVQKVFQERNKKKPSQEIAASLGLNYSLVYRMLKDPRNKKIVGAKLWNEVQNVYLSSKERIGTRNEVAIFGLLPATTREIRNKTGLSWLAVWQHLNRLRKQGKIDREVGRRGKWYRRE